MADKDGVSKKTGTPAGPATNTGGSDKSRLVGEGGRDKNRHGALRRRSSTRAGKWATVGAVGADWEAPTSDDGGGGDEAEEVVGWTETTTGANAGSRVGNA